MARTTQQIRDAWRPACSPLPVSVLPALEALDQVFQAHGYRPKAGQTWGYNCRKITGGTGYSLHAYDPGESFTFWSGVRINSAIATDVNSLVNPYGPRLVTDMPREMINDILAIRTIDGLQVFKWGGYYSKNKDAMHFEIQVSPEELARGIDWSTVRGSSEEAELDKEERRRLDAAYNALFVWRSYPGKPAERYEHMNILEAQNKGIIAALNKLLPPEDQIELDEIGLPKN